MKRCRVFAVLIAAAAIVTFLLIKVVPVFAQIFEEFGTKLPGPTQFLVDFSEFLKVKWWLVTAYINGGIIGFKLLSKIRLLKRIMDRVVLKMWLVGDLVVKVAVARFARTLGTLITSGVPILQALKITKDTIGNEVIQNAVQKVHDSIKEGETIAAPLDEAKVFPPMVVNMIDVGEETGSLDTMLMKVAEIYDAEVEAAIEAMLTMMEPAIVIFLGGIIGFIVISLYLPLFKLVDTLSGLGTGGETK